MAKNDIVIDVEHVTKSFKIYFDKGAQLKERLLSESATATRSAKFSGT